jgi:hypothetical protein
MCPFFSSLLGKNVRRQGVQIAEKPCFAPAAIPITRIDPHREAIWGMTQTAQISMVILRLAFRQKSIRLGPNRRLLIALHSPSTLLETGLHMCSEEKSGQ